MINNNQEITEFSERFNSFYDAVIREVKISFRNASHQTKIKVVLSAKDSTHAFNENWVNVIIDVEEVVGFTFLESDKISYQVLSNGIHIKKSGDFISFDFGFFIDAPENFTEYEDSQFHIVGKEFNWLTTDYQE